MSCVSYTIHLASPMHTHTIHNVFNPKQINKLRISGFWQLLRAFLSLSPLFLFQAFHILHIPRFQIPLHSNVSPFSALLSISMYSKNFLSNLSIFIAFQTTYHLPSSYSIHNMSFTCHMLFPHHRYTFYTRYIFLPSFFLIPLNSSLPERDLPSQHTVRGWPSPLAEEHGTASDFP